jgi:thioredoxin 1
VDAVAQADLADFYGVMTLPTTVVLDRQRRPVAINYGLTQLSKLRQQIAAVA